MSKDQYVEKYYDHLLIQSKKLFNKDLAQEKLHDLVELILSDKFGYVGSYINPKPVHNYCWGILLNMWRNSCKDKNTTFIEDIEYFEPIQYDIERDPLQTIYQDELRHEGYTDDQILKLTRIKSYVKRMSPSYQRLYNLYFIERRTYRDIAKIVNIPMSSIYLIVNKLKNNLYVASMKQQKPLY